MLSTLFFGSTALLFLAMSLKTFVHLRWVRRLPSLQALVSGGGLKALEQEPVRCSVVIAARDEQLRVEQTVRHLLAQVGVELEIIVVDDRSKDGTGDILSRLAEEDSRVQVKRVDVLPDGWLGKCHACGIGADAATGEWILFTDADCWLRPDVLVRAIGLAEREGVEHVTLTPGIAARTLGAQAWHLAFLITIANWMSGVNRDQPRAYLGLGAFNLVRAPAYRECGGYEALRLTVLDDVKLGLLLRRAGKRTRGFIGGDDVECHWSPSVRGMIKLMEKNYFAAVDFRLGVALAASLAGTLLLCAAVLGLLSGTKAGLGAALAPFSFILPAAVLARRLGWPLGVAVTTPFMLPVLLYAMLNSIIATVRRGGIWWRDTFYSIEVLRKGTVR
jgi:cellulose synthase/poly-beta-1,6-N-acetylglucosamine synthase-like glycosyltransferase